MRPRLIVMGFAGRALRVLLGASAPYKHGALLAGVARPANLQRMLRN